MSKKKQTEHQKMEMFIERMRDLFREFYGDWQECEDEDCDSVHFADDAPDMQLIFNAIVASDEDEGTITIEELALGTFKTRPNLAWMTLNSEAHIDSMKKPFKKGLWFLWTIL